MTSSFVLQGRLPLRGLISLFKTSRPARTGAVLCLPLLVATSTSAWACATCGCTLNPDAATGYSTTQGWRISLEYDYIHQDRLRSGTHSAATVPDGNELERETLNRYVTLGIHYAPSSKWSVQLYAPYVVRTHSTYGEFDSTQPLPELSSSRSASLGDLRLIVNYQGLLATRNLGIQFGVKLPTGQYGTAIKFNGGPAAGEPLDASLQPGTGSTDLILGAYYYVPISQDFDLVANGQFQSAIKHHMDQPGNDFRPGNATTLNIGLRYEHNPRVTPQFQVNLLRKSPDQGALADVQSTAGTVIYLSPGISMAVTRRLQVFGFMQIPVYSNLYGYQLFPRYTASVGASYAFQ